jgi:hypothetical protein
MAYKTFKPKSDRYGVMPCFASAAIAATSSQTITTPIPIPRRRCYLERATVTLSVLGVAAAGTILLTLNAVGTNGSTTRALATALSLESDGVATALVPVNLTITASTANRFLKEGETLQVSIASTNTNGTAPVGSTAVELLVQD